MKTNKKISFLLAIVMIFTSIIAPFSDVLKADGGGWQSYRATNSY